MGKSLLIHSHGIGDAILSLQCAYFTDRDLDIMSCTRNEVFKPIYYLFSNIFNLNIFQHKDKEKWGQDNWILNNQSELLRLKWKANFSRPAMIEFDYDNIYYIIPDLLYRNPLAFDYKKYNTNPQVIKQTRLLINKYKPENRIYVGLCTSTEGYLYNNIGGLLRKLSKELPNYEIYFPKLNTWAGKELDYGDLSNLPNNVRIHENPNFIESLEILRKSIYGIYTDNGPSHIAFQYGQPRLLLDPQYNRELWVSRWREDISESISINSSINDIVSVVKENLNTPQSLLLPRQKVVDLLINTDYNINWTEKLLFKY